MPHLQYFPSQSWFHVCLPVVCTRTIPQPHKHNRFLNCPHIFRIYSGNKEKSTLASSKIPQPSCSELGSQSTITCFDTGTVVGSSNEHWWIRKIIKTVICGRIWNVRYFKTNCFQWPSQTIFWRSLCKTITATPQSFKRQLQEEVAVYKLQRNVHNLFF